MKKGRIIRVKDSEKDFKEHLALMEQLFGEGGAPDFEGELLAVNPTAEEFATFDHNFEQAVEYGEATTESLKGTVVYFDKGSNRAFQVGENMVELVEQEVEEEINVSVGDTVEATGLGALFVELAGGRGSGTVIHVGGQAIVDPRVQEKVDSEDLEDTYINEGVLYFDKQLNDVMWLASDDYLVVK